MEDLRYVSLATTYEKDISFDSERFIKMRLKICHDGINPNKSAFSIEDIQKAESSIPNTPILANTKVDEENQTVDLGSHDMHWEKHKLKDGEYKLIYDELIVGVVPETCNYEIKKCDGKNYAFADCYIFREYSNYFEDFIEENGESKLSMEIIVDESKYDKKNNVYNITDFRYKGITFLGKTKGTGMIGAKAVCYEEEGKEKLFSLLDDLKLEIEKYQFSLKENDINNKNSEDGDIVNEKLELLATYNVELDSLEFSIDELSIDELKIKLDEFVAQSNEEDDAKPEDNFALNEQFMGELIEKLYTEQITTEWGNYPKYAFVDFDNEASEVYCYDREDWKLYGFKYSVSGDSVSIDFACKTRKKYSIVDFVDGTDIDMTFENIVKDVIESVIKTKEETFETLKSEYETYKSTYSTINEEVEKLQSFKEKTEKAEFETKINGILAEFEELSNIEEFKILKQKAFEYSDIEQLREKCFAIKGRHNVSINFAKNSESANKAPIVGITFSEDDGFGGILTNAYKK